MDINITLFGFDLDLQFVCRCVARLPFPKGEDYTSFTFLTVRDLMLAGF